MLPKTCLEGLLEFCDLAVQLGYDAYQRSHSGPVCVGNPSRSGELAGAEPPLDSAGHRIEVASPSAGFESCPDLGQREPGTDTWCGCPAQHS